MQAVELADRRLTIKAWVAPAEGVAGGAALGEELKVYAKQVLLPHKYPREVVFLAALPKTGTDKIDRQALRSLGAAQELEA